MVFAGRKKPLWFKLATLPLAWAGKMQSLAAVRREIGGVAARPAKKLQRWYWPRRGIFLQMYSFAVAGKFTSDGDGGAGTDCFECGTCSVAQRAIIAGGGFRGGGGKISGMETVAGGGFDGDERRWKKFARWRNGGSCGNRIVLLGERNDALELMQRAGVCATVVS